MRIAIVADDLYPGFGGQAVGTERWIRGLISQGHEIRVLAGEDKSPSVAPQGVKLCRVPAWQPGDVQTRFAWPSYPEIDKLLTWADIVYVPTPTFLPLLTCRIAKLRQIPVIVGFHTQIESATWHFQQIEPLVAAVLKTWYRMLHKNCDAIIAPSPFAARWASRLSDVPVYAISCGIDWPKFDESLQHEAKQLREKLLAEKKYLLCYVGRLAPEKRPQDLLKLAHYLPEDSYLAVAGKGPMLEELQEEVKEKKLSKSISFLGYINEREKAKLFLASDVFI
ncbi:MAG: glycosyltransferase, partial [Deinococcales bacterium]